MPKLVKKQVNWIKISNHPLCIYSLRQSNKAGPIIGLMAALIVNYHLRQQSQENCTYAGQRGKFENYLIVNNKFELV
jgi:hypothetical protein